MKGPNSELNNPDFPVGSMMGFDVKATTTELPTRDYQLIDKKTGLPVIMTVCLKKSTPKRWIIHGSTTSAGHIRLFNAEAGDKILAADCLRNKWKYKETLVGSPSLKAAGDAEIIELETVNGQFALLSSISFNEQGNPVYRCLADPLFSSSPAIQIFNDTLELEEQVLTDLTESFPQP